MNTDMQIRETASEIVMALNEIIPEGHAALSSASQERLISAKNAAVNLAMPMHPASIVDGYRIEVESISLGLGRTILEVDLSDDQ